MNSVTGRQYLGADFTIGRESQAGIGPDGLGRLNHGHVFGRQAEAVTEHLRQFGGLLVGRVRSASQSATVLQAVASVKPVSGVGFRSGLTDPARVRRSRRWRWLGSRLRRDGFGIRGGGTPGQHEKSSGNPDPQGPANVGGLR